MADAHGPVFLVEDRRGYNMGPPTVGVFGSHSRKLADAIASVHREVAARQGEADPDPIRVRAIPLAEFERIQRRQADIGPGPLDRVTSADAERAIMAGVGR
jgi:hypothetical protein